MKKIYGMLFASLLSGWGYSQIVLNEGFEAGVPPAGWIIFDNGEGLNESWEPSANANTGSGSAFISFENNGILTEDWLVTSQIDLAGVTNSELRFFAQQSYASNYGSEYRVMVSTASQSTPGDFTLVESWDESTITTTYDVYEEKIVDLSAYDGQQIYVAFVFVQDDGDNWYLDDVTVGAAPTCPEPSAMLFSMITDASAQADWTAGAAEGDWVIEYGETGFTQGTGTIVNASVTPTASLSPLNPYTVYDVYVKADCGSGDESTWAGPFTFTTMCSPVSITALPWTEDFEGAILPDVPCGWSVENVNADENEWNTVDDGAGQALHILYNSSEAMDDWAFTPELVLNAGTSYRLTFQRRVDSDFYPENMSVHIGTVAAAVQMTMQLADYQNMVNEEYQLSTVDFTVPSNGSYFIGFYGYSASNMYGIYVNDVTLDLSPNCIEPTALALDDLTFESALISWAPGGSETDWNIEYGETGFTPGSGTADAVNGQPEASIENLDPETTYDFYVQSDCGGDESGWVGPFTFTTPCQSVPVTVFPWIENFDAETTPDLPCGWIAENVNNDAYTWVTDTEDASSAPNALYIRYNSSQEMNDWVYTPELMLEAGTEYQLGFRYASSGTTFPESMSVSIGIDNESAAMTTELADFPQIVNDTFVQHTVSFTVPANGSYYIGFHGYSEADQFYLLVDDVQIDFACSAGFTLSQDTVCTQSSPVSATVTGDAGGVFSGTSGLTVDASTGAITPASSTPGVHEVSYIVTHAMCADTAVATIVIEDCAGIEEQLLSLIELYPNPTAGQLHVSLPESMSGVAVSVTDLAGKIAAFVQHAAQGGLLLDLSGLENGIYLVSFEINNTLETRRVILNR